MQFSQGAHYYVIVTIGNVQRTSIATLILPGQLHATHTFNALLLVEVNTKHTYRTSEKLEIKR